MTPVAISPPEFPWFRYEGYTFSLGLTDGTSAWLSGHSASCYDKQLRSIVVRGGMREQTATAYDKIRVILEAAGLGFGDVTRLVENVTVAGLASYPEAADVRERVLGGHTPALVTVVVDRLLRPDALIEIEVGATRDGGRQLSSARATPWHRTGIREGSGGLLYLPTVLPVDEEGRVVAPGEVDVQYDFCLGRIERALGEVGVPLAHLAKITVTGAAGFAPPSVDPARTGAVAAAHVTVDRLHVPGALVALDAVASRTPTREAAREFASDGGCAAVWAGRTLFLSQAAFAGSPEAGEGDVVDEATTNYRWVTDVLEAAGAGVQNLVKTIEYVVPEGLAAYRGVAQVRERMLRSPWPASTGAVCAAVGAGGALIGVEATAVVADGPAD